MPRILIVEDEKSLNKAMQQFFSTFTELEVVSVFDGEEAMVLMKDYKPDLITLDVMMPFKNGYQVADEILSDENLNKTKILFLTNVSLFEREDLKNHNRVKVVCKSNTSISEIKEIISNLLKE